MPNWKSNLGKCLSSKVSWTWDRMIASTHSVLWIWCESFLLPWSQNSFAKLFWVSRQYWNWLLAFNRNSPQKWSNNDDEFKHQSSFPVRVHLPFHEKWATFRPHLIDKKSKTKYVFNHTDVLFNGKSSAALAYCKIPKRAFKSDLIIILNFCNSCLIVCTVLVVEIGRALKLKTKWA